MYDNDEYTFQQSCVYAMSDEKIDVIITKMLHARIVNILTYIVDLRDSLVCIHHDRWKNRRNIYILSDEKIDEICTILTNIHFGDRVYTS